MMGADIVFGGTVVAKQLGVGASTVKNLEPLNQPSGLSSKPLWHLDGHVGTELGRYLVFPQRVVLKLLDGFLSVG
jgi:hypothetical protein